MTAYPSHLDDLDETIDTSSATPYTADPWDSPYFGSRVYLRYQAGSPAPEPEPVPTRATITAPTAAITLPPNAEPADLSAQARALPWDGPYFGAPVYLSFPDYPDYVGDPAPAAQPAPSVSAAEASAPAVVPARRTWLARLFGTR